MEFVGCHLSWLQIAFTGQHYASMAQHYASTDLLLVLSPLNAHHGVLLTPSSTFSNSTLCFFVCFFLLCLLCLLSELFL